MKVLSIDWDWFFPDSAYYDWGHQENKFFLEMIWHSRTSSRNFHTGAYALDEFVPSIPKAFWKLVTKNSTPIYVAESHASISALPLKDAIVTNLDAHHDCGYYVNPQLECGNWADHLHKQIKEYHLYYPKWRNEDDEVKPKRKPDSITMGLPAPDDYDYIFVCRSGCWTPPWYDSRFKSWLKQSGMPVIFIDQYAGKNRGITKAKAIQLKNQMEAMMKGVAI
jgi:hypothetical protein